MERLPAADKISICELVSFQVGALSAHLPLLLLQDLYCSIVFQKKRNLNAYLKPISETKGSDIGIKNLKTDMVILSMAITLFPTWDRLNMQNMRNNQQCEL